METVISIVVLLILAYVVYYAPFSDHPVVIEIDGVEYQISKQDGIRVMVQFNIGGVEHLYTKSFDHETLRDEWTEMFDKRTADHIKHIVIGTKS